MRSFKKYIHHILILLFAVSLLPVLALGRYARAAADDYCYGILTRRALQLGRGFGAAVWRTMSGYYRSWQGSFAAMGLMSLTPCIFSEQAYWITPVVMLTSLILGTVKLTDTLIRRILGGSRREVVQIAVPMLFLSIQFVPSPLNSFYWWNGAVYYTFLYGLSLCYLERFLALLFCPGRRPAVSVLLPGCVCGVMVGGGNYASALLMLLLGGTLLLYALAVRRARPAALTLFLAEAAAFAVSVLSPGNGVRQATVSSMPPILAIGAAVAQAAEDLVIWPNWPLLLLCAAWAPLLLRLAQKSGLRFRRPVPVLAAAFLFFAAQNTPHFYAVSTAGPLRLRNIVYFSSYWLILFAEWYLLGWARETIFPRFSRTSTRLYGLKQYVAAVLLLLCVCCGAWYYPTTFSAGCIRELSSGIAADYAAQHDSRLPLLRDPTVPDPVFPPIRARSILLYPGDITADPSNWKNSIMANYWNKNSVALIEDFSLS